MPELDVLAFVVVVVLLCEFTVPSFVQILDVLAAAELPPPRLLLLLLLVVV